MRYVEEKCIADTNENAIDLDIKSMFLEALSREPGHEKTDFHMSVEDKQLELVQIGDQVDEAIRLFDASQEPLDLQRSMKRSHEKLMQLRKAVIEKKIPIELQS